ncbi:uncharacterized protein BDZ99DRAFT_490851 [Mytilinidion resinicola]|uniref:Uncharacterized protein n=1 Tax=Mytilinidion resinicola TaxID=574789 RepID=A0A6A6Y9V0_9PEZI|nr:uncharacterized protein BDZ99DRAFT_490851 [Mytilinidion resinicola]KAF2805303.1 hypothetical protein BDZ99DRAFT_490851 [Mytilinidion resinicola]
MSWMDAWSRPGKHAAVPPPLYLTDGNHVPYCQTCGRVISARKAQQSKVSVVKYCSDRCRNRKPGAMDRRIERAIVALLNEEPESGIEKTAAKAKAAKGDRRVIVTMEEIKEVFFGNRHDPAKTFGRKKNRAGRALGKEDEERKSVDMAASEVNGGIGGEKGRAERTEEFVENLEKRQEGQRRAEEREMVRRAARRGIVFGFVVDEGVGARLEHHGKTQGRNAQSRRAVDADHAPQTTRWKCEALMQGAVVEPSFAKGDWAIRWREGSVA